jgi:hypothetical protein
MSNKIVFTKTIDHVHDEYSPFPSSFGLPEWYKKNLILLELKNQIIVDKQLQQ